MTTDAELIGWSLAGDDDAFAELVCRHESAVWSYLVRRAGRQAAEDLLSQVWVSAFSARRRYDRAFPSARPWLFGIAGNVLRRSWRDRSPEEGVDPTRVVTGQDPWQAEDDRIHGATLLRHALTRLRHEEREVLCLVVWEELTVADAARTLGIPAGTARRLLHQARLTLRRAPELVELVTLSPRTTAKEHR